MRRGIVTALTVGLLYCGVSGVAWVATFYIAASGSDSNNGTSKSTPWLHAPGMPTCSNNCNSHSPSPGDQIIFRGGDTWHPGSVDSTGHSGQGTFVTELTQSHATTNGQGYTSSETYAYSPSASSNSTVGAGTNQTGTYCAALLGSSDPILQAAGTACKSDTGYACTYNSSNHTVTCPGRTPIARPSSGAWDIGAYQFTGAITNVNPPTAFTATVK
jgi:hypothetical protein